MQKKVATTASDSRLDIFQSICDVNNIVIGVGIPTKSDGVIHITMVLFQPEQERRTYSKKYLHSDEDDFFVSGANFPSLIINSVNIGIAICYEISVPQHAEDAAENGVKFYIASVAKFSGGIEKALKTLQEIACKYRMTVLMSNCVGVADGHVCAGRSSIWNDKGNLLCQLDDANEGIIVWDTNAREFRIF